MFSGETYASTETGLLVALSEDGIGFRNIRQSAEPIFTPPGGIRDPMVLYQDHHWYLVYSHGGANSSLVFVATSTDLLNWNLVVTLRLMEDRADYYNFVNVPQWIVDPEGKIHIIACTDTTTIGSKFTR